MDDRVEEVMSVWRGEPGGRGGEGDNTVQEVGGGFADHLEARCGVGCELGRVSSGPEERTRTYGDGAGG